MASRKERLFRLHNLCHGGRGHCVFGIDSNFIDFGNYYFGALFFPSKTFSRDAVGKDIWHFLAVHKLSEDLP